jgi:methyl-accepting chemotaxis protein
MRTRLAAWLYTGPLGHLAAGLADWVELLARQALRRLTDPDCHLPDSASTQEIAASAQELARTADQLQGLVGRFRVTS